MRVDWGTRWGAIVPYSYGVDSEGNTHFLSFAAPTSSRSRAITQAVIEWSSHSGGESPPTENGWRLERDHKHWRRRAWRRLYRKGFRVVKLRIRKARS